MHWQICVLSFGLCPDDTLWLWLRWTFTLTLLILLKARYWCISSRHNCGSYRWSNQSGLTCQCTSAGPRSEVESPVAYQFLRQNACCLRVAWVHKLQANRWTSLLIISFCKEDYPGNQLPAPCRQLSLCWLFIVQRDIHLGAHSTCTYVWQWQQLLWK